jgi:DNA invertase Pin-like site-specific DNA recombinase
MKSKSKIKSTFVGYIHAGSSDASVKLQKEALKAVGCNNIYVELSDDIDFERTELVKAVKYAKKKKHGCIVVYSIEHLAENLENLSDICKVVVNLKLRIISILEDVFIIPYPNVKNFISASILKVGYVHTYQGDSSRKLQESVLKSEGCSKIYSGSSDGADFERPELVKAIKYAQKNKSNCIIINSFERMASSLENLCDICKVLKTLSMPLRSIDENIFIRKYSTNEEFFTSPSDLKSDDEEFEDEVQEKKALYKRINKQTIIKFLILAVILSGVYYWLLTRFDGEEMSEAQYEVLHEKTNTVGLTHVDAENYNHKRDKE